MPATTRMFVPPFLLPTANDLESWAERHEARDLLPVLLRTLVNSTCDGLQRVDFPGRDDSQRSGWDGRVETTEGNPWVPNGGSGWEFGTDARVGRKANEDYRKRTKGTHEADRRRLAFVFVTPRRWPGKEAWLEDRQREGQWRTVCVWDASDLEQWLEQSVPGQVLFEGCRGRNTRGVKSLDRCWVEWCADCQPPFTEEVFAESIALFGDKVLGHLRANPRTMLRIAASRQEGLAFLAAVLSQKDQALSGFRDRVAVFTEPGALSELGVGSPGFIPVVTSAAVERELAESGSSLTGFVVEPRTATQHESAITLDPLSHGAFMTALSSMGLDRERVQRLDRESGRSLTVLRRRLARSEALRSPEWSADAELARVLVPMVLVGAWVADKDADQYLIAELAGCESYDVLERQFTRLLDLEDAPVWSVGGFHGVVSKVDVLFGVHRWVTEEDIDRFLVVAELVLSERDPALDLAEDKRWAAPVYGKDREISPPLRKGVAESLVLLAIHGHRLFGGRLRRDPAHKVADLVGRLLEPLTREGLLSQSSNLPLYAEAVPETFLEIFEQDLSRKEPVVEALMGPARDTLFQRADRVDLLWALELLAWHPEWLSRVVAVLGELAEIEPEDNLSNSPSESLQAIFRSWMPQTATPVEQRIAAFDALVKDHPAIAWAIATSEIEPGRKHGSYAHKPRWRDYALGFGEPVTNGGRHAFVVHCVKTCLGWPSHSRETLADLMGSAESFGSPFLGQLEQAIDKWAACAEDRDRAWLRERIRVSTGRTMRRNSSKSGDEDTAEGVLMARRAFESLQPADPVWKHAWLFENSWVAESWDEMDEDYDFRARDERIRNLRLDAVREVAAARGPGGVMQLAFSGSAPHTVGRIAAEVIDDEQMALDVVRAVLEDGDILAAVSHQSLVSGLLQGIGGRPAICLVQRLWPECGGDVGTLLLCLCDFDRTVWQAADALGDGVANEYWIKVQPFWARHTDDDLAHAVARLLQAGRPWAAFDYAHLDWGRVESKQIRRILLDLPRSAEPSRRGSHLDAYTIRQALNVLNKRGVFSQAELAQLEFLYLEIFWHDEDGLPNLEKEIEENPDLFCQAITLAFRREDDEDRQEPTQEEGRAAQRAYRLLDTLTRLPGHDKDGDLKAEKLTHWVLEAQRLCDGSGRKGIGDQQIGRLLSNAPTGDDGVWPCGPVRETLEAVLNEDIRLGFEIGRRNSRGAHVRSEGGAQERELAAQYEAWGRACEYAYPRVATALRQIASAYEAEARWHDQESAVQRRLGY
ncbi:MAG: addiction module antitoxin [Gammaproteobacteria bacterium]|nr:addiction module antitoxin [Gammaproteobacteria bacterium]